MRPTLCSAWMVAAALTWSAGVAAQGSDQGSRAAARQLGTAGVEAYQAGNYPLAVEKLEKAYEVLKAPSLGLWSARALVGAGRLLDASERYVEVTRLQPTAGDLAVQEQAKKDAATELEALAPRIPNVVIVLEGAQPPEVTLTLDGQALSTALVGEKRPVNLGKHVIEGRRGEERVTAEVTIGESETKNAVLRFTASSPAPVVAADATPPADAPSEKSGGTSKTLGWIGIGAGAAAIGVGTVTGIMAMGQRSDIDDNPQCRDGVCLESEESEVDKLNSLRTISTVGFVAGAVLAGVGVTLLLTSGSSEKPSASIWLGPSSGGVRGRF